MHPIPHARTRARIAVLTVISLAASPIAPLVRAQAPAAKAPAAKPPPASPGAGPADQGWPRAYSTASGAALVIYQPQVASWTDQKHAVLYLGRVLHAEGRDRSRRSARIKLEADTERRARPSGSSTSRTSRSPSRTSRRSTREQVRRPSPEISRDMPRDERVIALDRVLANIDKSQIIPKNVEGVKADPPPIFFSKTPAVLVNIDGDPIWSADQEQRSEVRRQHELGSVPARPDQDLLPAQRQGLAEGGDVNGPWTPAGTLPESFKKLPADDNWKDVKARLPGTPLSDSQAPTVFVSTDAGGVDPAERRSRIICWSQARSRCSG